MDKSLPVRRDLVQALIAILSQGIQENDLDDSEQLLNAIRILDPELQGLDEFASYIAIKRGQVREALRTYLAAPADNSKWYVMMALCLKLTDDPTWHWHAMQSLERQDASARYAHNLARILLGMEAADETMHAPGVAVPAAAPATIDVAGQYPRYLAV